jgi:hypothetical protein
MSKVTPKHPTLVVGQAENPRLMENALVPAATPEPERAAWLRSRGDL